MHYATRAAWFSFKEPISEWRDFSYLQPAKPYRRWIVALSLTLWIAVLDLCLPRTNFAVLYVAPILLLVQGGDLRRLSPIVGTLVALTFGIYFLKNFISSPEVESTFVDYRLLNRVFVALTLIAIGPMLRLWTRWQEDLSDAEYSAPLRYQDQEISATFAVLCSVPLIALIAICDFFAPANFNLAILYQIPLFICGWSRSRRLLWTMLAVLSVMSIIAFIWGPPSTIRYDEPSLPRNRLLALAGMTVVTVIMHYWMGRKKD